MAETIVVGLAGGSGSGKTTLAEALVKNGPGRRLLHLDNYQHIEHPPDWKPPQHAGMDNWEHPAYIDWPAFIRDLERLKSGKPIRVVERDQTTLKPVGRKDIKPGPLLLVEGYLLFYHPRVIDLLDVKVFLDAPAEARVARRTKAKPRGYVENILLPMHDKYIEPTKVLADLIINTGVSSLYESVLEAERLLLSLGLASFS